MPASNSFDESKFVPIEPERIARLSPEQQDIVLQREEKRKEQLKVIALLRDSDPEVQQKVLDFLRDSSRDYCEHDRSMWSTCHECNEIEKILWPERYDENGDEIFE